MCICYLFDYFTIIFIFLKEPLIRKFEEDEKMFPNGFGAFFVEGFFELFEVVLSFITNTMSFKSRWICFITCWNDACGLYSCRNGWWSR